jgi:hypothetical protein
MRASVAVAALTPLRDLNDHEGDDMRCDCGGNIPEADAGHYQKGNTQRVVQRQCDKCHTTYYATEKVRPSETLTEAFSERRRATDARKRAATIGGDDPEPEPEENHATLADAFAERRRAMDERVKAGRIGHGPNEESE